MNATDLLTPDELQEIAEYTIQKIENYPKHFGKTVENYFDLLFPDEVNSFIMRREINRRGEENRVRRLAVVT
jgi:hypothetical protein